MGSIPDISGIIDRGKEGSASLFANLPLNLHYEAFLENMT